MNRDECAQSENQIHGKDQQESHYPEVGSGSRPRFFETPSGAIGSAQARPHAGRGFGTPAIAHRVSLEGQQRGATARNAFGGCSVGPRR